MPPLKASRSPSKEDPGMGGVVVGLSPEMRSIPIAAATKATQNNPLIFCLRINESYEAVQTGEVQTSNVDTATEVYCNDAIQVAK